MREAVVLVHLVDFAQTPSSVTYPGAFGSAWILSCLESSRMAARACALVQAHASCTHPMARWSSGSQAHPLFAPTGSHVESRRYLRRHWHLLAVGHSVGHSTLTVRGLTFGARGDLHFLGLSLVTGGSPMVEAHISSTF